MEINPAAGKILGMLMAYAVSSLGLLLAYYNYRKRILKAERIFSPVATAVIIGVITLAVVGAVLTAAVASSDAEGLWPAITSNLIGLALPAFIVLVSVLLTWMLFRHFSRRVSGAKRSEKTRSR
jgi:xanthine/uracil permease